jgi:hypothetical protein
VSPVRDPETIRTPDGDPEYLAGALERAERSMPLRPVDVQELGYRIGINAARQVARDVESYARDRQRWAGIHQSRPLPFPPALAKLFARLRDGHRLASLDAGDLGRWIHRAGRRIGRRQARRLTRTARRLPASQARALTRRSRRPRGRR